MNLEEKWSNALRETEIVRARIKQLLTFEPTSLPYLFLAPSAVNIGDTVVRWGKILVNKPAIILPKCFPQFSGFDFEEDYQANEDTIRNFLLIRGVSFPSFKYCNETSNITVYEGKLEKAIKHFADELEKKEDVVTGLIVGPEDCWQLSVLIFVGGMVTRSGPNDVKRLLNKFKDSEL